MGKMRAVIVDPEAPARLRLGKIKVPEPVPSEVLVRVSAISLNRGEVRRLQAAEEGFRPGWDLAGTVERAAADGTGPEEGVRVVGLLSSGAWAELVAVPTDSLAELPESVSFELGEHTAKVIESLRDEDGNREGEAAFNPLRQNRHARAPEP